LRESTWDFRGKASDCKEHDLQMDNSYYSYFFVKISKSKKKRLRVCLE